MLTTDEVQRLIVQAEKLSDQEKYDELIALLPDEVLELNKVPEVYFYRAITHYRKEEREVFQRYANGLKQQFPGHYMSLHVNALMHHDSGEYDTAIEYFSESIKLKPNKHHAWNGRGIELYLKGEHNKAIEDYTECLRLKPDYFQAMYNRGNAWAAERYFDKAIEDYSECMRLNHNYYQAFYGRGNAWSNKGEYDKAIEDFNECIKLKPDNHIAWHALGVVWYNIGEYDKAIECNSECISLKPDFLDAWNNRGNGWANKGEYDKAIENYDECIRLNPEYHPSWSNRGLTWFAKGEHEKALENYNECIRLKPDYEDAYNNLGYAYEMKGEFDLAIKNYKAAISYNSKVRSTHRNLGNVLNAQGKNQEAIKAYQTALEAHPDDFRAQYLLQSLMAEEGMDFPYEDQGMFSTLEIVLGLTEGLLQHDKVLVRQLYTKVVVPALNKIKDLAKDVDIAWQESFGNDQMEECRMEGIDKEAAKKAVAKHVAHYTNLKVADLLIMAQATEHNVDSKVVTTPAKSKMRYSNAVFMNDPEEGRLLTEALHDLEEREHKGKEQIKAAFIQAHQNKSHFYIGSFMPVDQGHEDELLMWRTYGKDDQQNEAAGCCLVLDFAFFDKHRAENMLMQSTSTEQRETEYQPLYRVIYYDKRKKEFIADKDGEIQAAVVTLKNALRKVLAKKIKKAEKDSYEEKLNNTLCLVVHHALSEVRFFFKSADYAYENELRVVVFNAQTATIGPDVTLPRRMFIESTKNLKPHLVKLVIGPKVPHPDRWMYLEEQMRRDHPGSGFELIQSKVSFQ